MKQKQASSALRTLLRTKLINSSKYNQDNFFLNVQYLPSFLKYVQGQFEAEERKSIVSYELQNLILEIAAKGVEGEQVGNIDDLTAYVVNYIRKYENYWEKFSNNWHVLQSKDDPDYARVEEMREAEAINIYNRQMKEVKERYSNKRQTFKRFQIQKRRVLEQNYKVVEFLEKQKLQAKLHYFVMIKLKEYAVLKHPELDGVMLEYYILSFSFSAEERKRKRKFGLVETGKEKEKERHRDCDIESLRKRYGARQKQSDSFRKSERRSERQRAVQMMKQKKLRQEQEQEEEVGGEMRVEEQNEEVDPESPENEEAYNEFVATLLAEEVETSSLFKDEIKDSRIIRNVLRSFEILSEISTMNNDSSNKQDNQNLSLPDLESQFEKRLKTEDLILLVQNWFDSYCSYRQTLDKMNNDSYLSRAQMTSDKDIFLVGCPEPQETVEGLAAEWHKMLNCEEMQNANKYKFTEASKIHWTQAQYKLFLQGLIAYSHLSVNNKKIANFMGKHIEPNHVKHIKGQYLRHVRAKKGNLGKVEFIKRDFQNFSMKIFQKAEKSKSKGGVKGKGKKRSKIRGRSKIFKRDMDKDDMDEGEDDSSY